MTIPLITVLLQSVLGTVPNALTALGRTSALDMLLMVLAVLALILVVLANTVVSTLAAVMLNRLYYMMLTQDTPVRFEDGWRFIQRLWPKLLAVMLCNLPMGIGFVVLDTVVVFLGFGGSWLVLSMLSFPNTAVRAGAVVAVILWGFVILALLLSLIAIQMITMSMPLMAMVSEKTESVGKAFRIAFASVGRSLFKTALFGSLLVVFTVAVSQTIQLPMNVWLFFEVQRTILQEHSSPENLPWYVKSAANLWTSLTMILLIPFNAAALSLFWYDCQVNTQGLDLTLWLERLKQRHQIDASTEN